MNTTPILNSYERILVGLINDVFISGLTQEQDLEWKTLTEKVVADFQYGIIPQSNTLEYPL